MKNDSSCIFFLYFFVVNIDTNMMSSLTSVGTTVLAPCQCLLWLFEIQSKEILRGKTHYNTYFTANLVCFFFTSELIDGGHPRSYTSASGGGFDPPNVSKCPGWEDPGVPFGWQPLDQHEPDDPEPPR